ncbi:TIGR03086 family metal-binding protein [Pseudonocardia sp. TRM90224]|uniref:TIGR03086 family metal-binding protein n=1 Tax=Pseudonocardia sp. TRM90224 TaxID=2812678 RepID=UPI001E5E7271|nr:TIGR03086 family metal-binding protein [Pseudonocardia sp. TRM90224]
MTDETTSWPVLEEAHGALRGAVAGVTDWNAATPCAQWNATQVLQHAAGDQIAFAAFLTGGPGPSEDPFAPSGSLESSPGSVAELALKQSADAWAAVAADATEVSVPVPPNSMSAAMGVGACALDAVVHAWDLAVASGQPSPLSDSIARELLPVAQQIVEPLRAYGAFAAALPPEAGDGDAAVLLRYLGRRPDWSA